MLKLDYSLRVIGNAIDSCCHSLIVSPGECGIFHYNLHFLVAFYGRKRTSFCSIQTAMSCSHTATAVSLDGGQSVETQHVGEKVICSECTAERKRRRVYRWKLIASILFPAFLASIDATIIAPAFPSIASEFGG